MRLDGRTERRIRLAVPVRLLTAEKVLVADQATTVNVSSQGARIVTWRRWQPEQELYCSLNSGELRVQARVIYCEPMADGHFCVGLQFLSALIDWEL